MQDVLSDEDAKLVTYGTQLFGRPEHFEAQIAELIGVPVTRNDNGNGVRVWRRKLKRLGVLFKDSRFRTFPKMEIVR